VQVLFSSVAALLGSAGQAGYSAANAGLDALAMSARHQGRPVTAVQWGPWAGAGMAAGSAGARARLQRLGLGMLTAQQGLATLESVLAGSGAGTAVQAAVAADWPRLLAGLHPDAQALFAELAGTNVLDAPAGPVSVMQHPAVGLRRFEDLTARVAAAVETVVGRAVGIDEPLMASGLDSLGAVELLSSLQVHICACFLAVEYLCSTPDHQHACMSTYCICYTRAIMHTIIAHLSGDMLGYSLTSGLQADFGVRLPATVVIDCPTTAALAQHIAVLLQPGTAAAPIRAIWAQPHGRDAPAMVAVTSLISCGAAQRGPSPCHSIADADAVGLVPLERWDVEPQVGAPSLSDRHIPPRFAAYLPDPGAFDPPVFGLSSAEAALIDPQQRLLLECVAEAQPAHDLTARSTRLAIEALSGFPAAARQDGWAGRVSTGVFVGLASSDYGGLLLRHTVAGGFHATACAPSLASGRLSFAFGFGGPSVSIGALPPCFRWKS